MRNVTTATPPRRITFMVYLLFVASLHCDVVMSAPIRRFLAVMLEDSGLGLRRTEAAGFVVIGDDGRLALTRWPDQGELGAAFWYGPIPKRAIAIVHTHPNWKPLPSTVDAQTAEHSHLPVYVITRTTISKTCGAAPEIVFHGNWR